MKTFKLLTLLIIGLLVFGSAGFFGYELFIKPSRAEKRERDIQASAPAPTATPDPAKSEDVLRILGDLQSTYPELTAIEVVRTSNVDLCKMYENMYAKQDPKLSFFACKEKASHVILKR